MQNLHKKFSGSSIKIKLFCLNFFIAVGIAVFLMIFYRSFSNTLEKEKMIQTKNISESAMGAIRYFYDLSLSGNLEGSKAKEYAINALSSATYGGNGYFWINSGQGILLMQPYTPERVGINQINWTDVKGHHIFREFIEKAKRGGGWVTYYWPKPDIEGDYPKISYVSYFEPWDWVLGTGVYLDDMNSNIFWAVFNASAILFAIFIVFIATSIFVVNYFVRQLKELALHDPLTDLYNKGVLNEMIPTILKKQKRLKEQVLAVTFIDIDHFKKVNDTFGHDCGDKVLRTLAAVITDNTRPDDDCIRYGGEEFVIIGFYKDKTSALNAVERLKNEVSNAEFTSNDKKFTITISAGIAFHDSGEESFDATLKQADAMLYRSKEAGRNRISL